MYFEHGLRLPVTEKCGKPVGFFVFRGVRVGSQYSIELYDGEEVHDERRDELKSPRRPVKVTLTQTIEAIGETHFFDLVPIDEVLNYCIHLERKGRMTRPQPCAEETAWGSDVGPRLWK